jgi:hypothetical protein
LLKTGATTGINLSCPLSSVHIFLPFWPQTGGHVSVKNVGFFAFPWLKFPVGRREQNL